MRKRPSQSRDRRNSATSSTMSSKLARHARGERLTSWTARSKRPLRPGNWTNGEPLPPSRPGTYASSGRRTGCTVLPRG
eukprot:5982323-Prymnesium_polylepis.1